MLSATVLSAHCRARRTQTLAPRTRRSGTARRRREGKKKSTVLRDEEFLDRKRVYEEKEEKRFSGDLLSFFLPSSTVVFRCFDCEFHSKNAHHHRSVISFISIASTLMISIHSGGEEIFIAFVNGPGRCLWLLIIDLWELLASISRGTLGERDECEKGHLININFLKLFLFGSLACFPSGKTFLELTRHFHPHTYEHIAHRESRVGVELDEEN
jgi:hypothetical protein